MLRIPIRIIKLAIFVLVIKLITITVFIREGNWENRRNFNAKYQPKLFIASSNFDEELKPNLTNDRRAYYPVRGRYEHVTGYKQLSEQLTRIVPRCCKLIHINMMGRHSTRYPIFLLLENDHFFKRKDLKPFVLDVIQNFKKTMPKKGSFLFKTPHHCQIFFGKFVRIL